MDKILQDDQSTVLFRLRLFGNLVEVVLLGLNLGQLGTRHGVVHGCQHAEEGGLHCRHPLDKHTCILKGDQGFILQVDGVFGLLPLEQRRGLTNEPGCTAKY